MKFSYFRFPLKQHSPVFGDAILKPIIPISVSLGERKLKYAALVDSGADFCIFDAEIGEYLGLDIRKGQRETFGGVQESDPSEAFFHIVKFNLSKEEIELSPRSV